MHLSSNIAKATVIVLVLLMASVAFATLPVEAQTAGGKVTGGPLPSGVTPQVTLSTIGFLSISPYTVGIGQQVLVNMWLQPPYQVNRVPTGFKVTFTKPDGTTDTIGPMNGYAGDCTAWFNYVPDQVGTWKAVFDYPGDYCPSGWYLNGLIIDNPTGGPVTDSITGKAAAFLNSTWYKPCQTPTTTFIVQQDQVFSWPPAPLPTGYWTRPISPEYREWYAISGSFPWMFSNNYRYTGPYVTAPNTAHIMWRREGELGGLIGGDVARSQAAGVQTSFYNGGGFGEDTNKPNLIFVGRCYQTITKPMQQIINGTMQTSPTSVWECYDLRTGEIYWDLTGITQPPTTILYETPIPEVEGAESSWRAAAALVYLGNDRLIKYNPYTGAVTLNISIPFGGTLWGDSTVYSVQNLGNNVPIAQRYRLINWTLSGGYLTNATAPFSSRVRGNISWPSSSLGTVDFNALISVSRTSTTTPNATTGNSEGSRFVGVSLVTGQALWNITTDDRQVSNLVADHGKFAFGQLGGAYECYDLNTGKHLWSGAVDYPWGCFWAYSAQSAYDMIFAETYDGVYAFDWNTGKTVWHFIAESVPFETPYTDGENNTYSFFNSAGRVVVSDGKIYAFSNEHTPSQPMTRGWNLYCINATSGEGIWNITGYMTPGAVADGYLTAGSGYDGYMYVFGPGPSKTTVTAPQTTVPVGTSVLIQGTVMDQSPGTLPSTTTSTEVSQVKPDVACVSAASMSTYMEYIYMQTPIPTSYTVTGVPVQLLAISETGNTINIGTVTSDASGTFKTTWTPPDKGLYTITATFAGDKSYGSSWAETGLSVGPAATSTDTGQQQQITVPDYTMTLVVGFIAVIIAVAIVGILVVRRK